MLPLLSHLDWFKNSLNDDLKTYEKVTSDINPPIGNGKGALCFGMGLTAFAAIDFISYIMHGGELSSVGTTGQNFDRIGKTDYFKDLLHGIDHSIFYKVLRNGMVHQLMPRNVSLDAVVVGDDSNKLLIPKDNFTEFTLNTFFLLKKTIDGYKAFYDDVKEMYTQISFIEPYESRLTYLYELNQKDSRTSEENKELAKWNEIKAKLTKTREGAHKFNIYQLRLNALFYNDLSLFFTYFDKLIYPKLDPE